MKKILLILSIAIIILLLPACSVQTPPKPKGPDSISSATTMLNGHRPSKKPRAPGKPANKYMIPIFICAAGLIVLLSEEKNS